MLCLLITLFLGQATLVQNKTPYTADQILELSDNSLDEALSILAESGKSPFDFGMEISASRPVDALHWFSVLIKEDDSRLEYHFGVAWAYWIQDDLLASQKEATYLISKAKNNSLIRARTYFLLGEIYLQLSQKDLAKAELERGMLLFEEIERFGGAFSCALGLVDLFYLDNQLDKASQMLSKAVVLNKKRSSPSSGLGAISFHEGSILFRSGRFADAARLFEKAYFEIESIDLHMKMMAKTNFSICMTLSGDHVKALDAAREVETFLKSTNDTGYLFQYNNIAWVLIYKCQGTDTRYLEAKIQNWLSETSTNAEIVNLFSIVKNASCQ